MFRAYALLETLLWSERSCSEHVVPRMVLAMLRKYSDGQLGPAHPNRRTAGHAGQGTKVHMAPSVVNGAIAGASSARHILSVNVLSTTHISSSIECNTRATENI